MKTTRREFMRTTGAGALGATLVPALVRGQAPGVSGGDVYDVAVVGAGVFGAWIAYRLAQAGRRVALLAFSSRPTLLRSAGSFVRLTSSRRTPRTKVDSSLSKYLAIRATGISPAARPRYAAICRARDAVLCLPPLTRSGNCRPDSTATADATLASVRLRTTGDLPASRNTRSAKALSPLTAWA
jgi:FAD dependent oxidoreductase